MPLQLHLGLAAGLALAALTSVFLPASGAHVSPAVGGNNFFTDFIWDCCLCQVCLAAALLHRISPLRAVAMAIGQCGGAIAAAALVLGITGIARDHFPGLQKTDTSLEFMLSFLAVLVQLGAGGGQGQG